MGLRDLLGIGKRSEANKAAEVSSSVTTLRDDLGSFLRAEPESTHVESSELRLWGGGGRFAHLNVRIQRVEELPARLPPLHVLARRVGRQCARLAHHLRLRGAVE